MGDYPLAKKFTNVTSVSLDEKYRPTVHKKTFLLGSFTKRLTVTIDSFCHTGDPFLLYVSCSRVQLEASGYRDPKRSQKVPGGPRRP